MTRRQILGAAAAASALPLHSAESPAIDPGLVRHNDEAVARNLQAQNTDRSSRWYGGIPDSTELYGAGSASGFVDVLTASFVSPGSKYYKDRELVGRIETAAKFMEKCQSPDGNISLLITNFNSPPDTGFVVWNVAEAASVARKHGAPEIEKALEPFLRKAAQGMTKGGVHTPNHRWVVSSALSQIHALWPDPKILARIDAWLAEGIDIDEDGQFTERSTTIYNSVCDRAFTTLALKLKRRALLDPVQKNMDAMFHMLHADGEVVTEISRRQDLNERGTMDRYWYPLRTLAVLHKDGRCANLVRQHEARIGSLATLLDNPEIAGPLPASAPLPDNFERTFNALRLVRIRRGPTSASVLLDGTSRFFTVRRGGAIIEAIRFSSAFFGKGQFIPTSFAKDGSGWTMKQHLESGYYQPLDPVEKVAAGEWSKLRPKRRVTELCKLDQSATVTETPKGFRLKLASKGTEGVPLAVEIGLREGSRVEGAEALPNGNFLAVKPGVTITHNGNTIRLGSGRAEHKYVQVRGSENPLPGPKIYLTALTPFEHILDIELS